MVGHNQIHKEGLVLFYFTIYKLCEAREFSVFPCLAWYLAVNTFNKYLLNGWVYVKEQECLYYKNKQIILYIKIVLKGKEEEW